MIFLNKGLFVFSFLFFFLNLSGQVCSENFLLRSQDDIDSFQIVSGGCTVIDGNLKIWERLNGEIVNLQGLSHLESIRGNLTVTGNAKLQSLSGLDQLDTIGGNLEVSLNDSMLFINGLEGIKKLNDLTILRNGMLEDVSGLSNLSEVRNIHLEDMNASISFPSLKKVSGYFLMTKLNFSVQTFLFPSLLDTINGVLTFDQISFLPVLNGMSALKHLGGLTIHRTDIDSITGFDKLKSIEGKISIEDNGYLDSLAAFQYLTSVGGSISIESNPGLKDLSIFKNLEIIPGDVTLHSNSHLTSLIDMAGIREVQGDLSITYFYNLDSLSGLDSLVYIGGDLQLSNLSSITDLRGLDQLNILKGSLTIGNNSSMTSYHGLENLDSIYQRANISTISQNGFQGLNNLVYIGDQFTITGAESVAGLDSLKSVGGLTIRDSPLLESLDPLSNLREIRGNLLIDAVRKLKKLPDWKYLKEIQGSVYMEEIYDMPNFYGMDSLHTVHGPLTISSVDVNSFAGLHNLKTVDGKLVLSGLDYITDIDELENLRQVNGNIRLNHNFYLQNINGLRNVNPDSVFTRSGNEADIRIYANYELSNCSVEFVCEALKSDDKTVEASYNKKGCDHTFQIEFKCGEPASCQPFNVFLRNQAQVDSFSRGNPECSLIRGELVIEEQSLGSIQNLDSLYRIKTIGKSLKIINNHALTNLDGLINLQNIGGGVQIQNNSQLHDISALAQVDPALFGLLHQESLDVLVSNNPMLDFCSIEMACNVFTIPGKTYSFFGNGELCTSNALVKEQCVYPKECALNGPVTTQDAVNFFPIKYPGCEVLNSDLIVDPITSLQVYNLKGFKKLKQINGDLVIRDSRSMTDLNGLDSLETVNGSIIITNNKKLRTLQSLSGITMDSLSQTAIEITGNDSLSICAIEPICAALTDVGPHVIINANHTNCNTKDEVLSACIVNTTHPAGKINITIYPNPTDGELHFRLDEDEKAQMNMIAIYDHLGAVVFSEKFSPAISIDGFAPGIYTIVLSANDGNFTSARILLLQ